MPNSPTCREYLSSIVTSNLRKPTICDTGRPHSVNAVDPQVRQGARPLTAFLPNQRIEAVVPKNERNVRPSLQSPTNVWHPFLEAEHVTARERGWALASVAVG